MYFLKTLAILESFPFFAHTAHSKIYNYTVIETVSWSDSFYMNVSGCPALKKHRKAPENYSNEFRHEVSNRDAISHQATRSQQKRPGAFIHPEKKSFADHFSIFLFLPWSQLLGIPIVGPDSSSTFLSPFLQSLLFCLLPQKIFALIEVRDACSEYP